MKTLHFKAGILALAGSMALAGTAHAAITGASSDAQNANVGASTVNAPPYHNAGLPGIGVQATGIDNLVDLAGLTTYSSVDAAGVYTLNTPSTAPTDHSALGAFHFAKVSGANVYFGEWSQTASAADGTHTVYYVGDDGGTTTVPTSGVATYAVKGVSDYATNGALSGTFTANFASGASGTLQGSLTAGNGYAVDIGTASIVGANIIGAGGSASQAGATLASGGAVSGQFYGSNAAALAGIVNFGGNSRYNTAFGGARN